MLPRIKAIAALAIFFVALSAAFFSSFSLKASEAKEISPIASSSLIKTSTAPAPFAESPPFSSIEEDERIRLNVIQAIQIAIACLTDVLGSRDRIVVANVAENVLTNLNQKEIDYNFETIGLYNSILAAVKPYGLDKARKDLFRLEYDRKALYAFADNSSDEGPVDGWLDYLAPAFGSVLSDFLDYAVHGEDYRKALDPSVYELSPNESQALAESLDGLLDRAFETLKRNSKPTDRKISKEILKKFGEALGSGDPAGVLEKLAPMEDELGFYPPYWFFRGYSLLTLGRTAEAEADFQKFEAVWRPVLVKDGMLADAAKFSLLKAISLGDEVKELKYADLIANHADKDGWINSLLAGVVYDELGDREKAEDCFQVNLDNGRGPLASGLALDYVRTGGSAAEGLREFAERKPYYDDGAREIVIVRESAAAGDPLAQYALGILTLDGVATKRDYVDAAKWLGLAASHGYARAQNALGEMCRDGRGVPVDLAKAANLFFQAADQGDAQAQANLGRLYLTGSGVGKNPAEAARWLALAAARGDMGAQATLWETYLRGEGSNRNLTEGLKWLRQAAENGSPSAQFQLGRAYDQGEGVPIDRTEALKWLRAAAEGGSAEAKLALKDR